MQSRHVRSALWGSLALALTLAVPTTAVAQTRVCVKTQIKSWTDADEDAKPKPAAPKPAPQAAPPEPDPEDAAKQAEADEAFLNALEAAEAGDGTASEEEATAPEEEATALEAEATLAPDPPGRQPQSFAPFAAKTSVLPTETVVPKESKPEFQPEFYLKRLVEHYVTHKRGFEAVRGKCTETIRVELYALDQGWTVFARYSGHAREEKVDRVRVDEFDSLAQRLAASLLDDRPIEATLSRRTVLRADSEGRSRRIQGGAQFLFSLGTTVLVGLAPTAPENGNDPAGDQVRYFAPFAVGLGVRNLYRAWALDATAGALLGTSKRASGTASGGGHVDYGGGFAASLHFLRYVKPSAVNSFYFGGGATVQADRYRVIQPTSPEGRQDDPRGAWGGGTNVDIVIGYEFMRASSLHFFGELGAGVPAYQVNFRGHPTRDVNSYIPNASFKIGLLH